MFLIRVFAWLAKASPFKWRSGGMAFASLTCNFLVFVNSLCSLTRVANCTRLAGELQVAFFAKLTSFVKLKNGFLSNPGSHPTLSPFKKTPVGSLFKWRSGGDSNPRYSFSTIYRFSKPTPSASRPPLHIFRLQFKAEG